MVLGDHSGYLTAQVHEIKVGRGCTDVSESDRLHTRIQSQVCGEGESR